MTRIISGFAGSLALAVPKSGTRPTTDRVREALFSALEARDVLDGARVLDLYSGSGALGLEAASRGAAEITLVDSSREAAQVSRRNADRVLRAAPKTAVPQIRTVSQPVRSFLSTAGGGWDLVFIDPPYELIGAELVEDLQLLASRLDPEALVLVERASRDPEPAWPSGFAATRRTTYGETAVYWLHLTEPAAETAEPAEEPAEA